MTEEINARRKAISNILECHEQQRWKSKKDISRVIADHEAGLVILEKVLQDWDSLLRAFRDRIDDIISKEWEQDCRISEDVLAIAQRLLDCYCQTRDVILMPALEYDQKEIVSGIGKLLDSTVDLLRLCLPEKSQMARPDIFYHLLPSEVSLNELKLSQRRRGLDGTKRKLEKERGRQGRKPLRRRLQEAWIDSKLQIRLLVIVIPLLYSTNWWLQEEILATPKLIAKLFICCVVLLWFPSQFVASFKNWRVTSWIFYALLWSFVLLLWVYGLLRGSIAIILLAIPLARLLQSSREDFDRNAQRIIRRQVYWTAGFSLFAVGAFLTRENLWIVGAVIWWTFAIVSQLSFRHFRFTFDMIDALTPDHDSALVKRRLIYFALFTSVVILIPGFLGRLEREFILDIYKEVATISFGLVAILFGVQAIVPSITSWGGGEKQKRTPSQVREMKLLLRSNQGLMGFLQIFFIVFLISLIGIGVTSILPEMPVVVDLSLSFLTTPTLSIVDWINPSVDFQYSPETTRVFIQTILFSVLVCLFSYSLAILYYLFIATNTLILPIQDALMSQPVHIESERLVSGDEGRNLLEKLKQSLQRSRQLRGEVVTKLSIVTNEAGQPLCTVVISGDFDSTAGIVDKTLVLLRAIFAVQEIQSAQVIVVKASLGPRESDKLLSLDVTRVEFDFLQQKTDGMDTEYKMIQLGAHIRRYLLPESQIL
jgi:hypothetical protein